MIRLRKAVTSTKTVEYEKRPALYAQSCANCGEVFHMRPFCNEKNVAILRATFDNGGVVLGPDGRSMGNGFVAEVCSFDCAGSLFEGGWRTLKEYKPFAKAGCELARATLTITNNVTVGKKALVAQWEAGCDE